MTRDQLDAIRARVEAATPGPWRAQAFEWKETAIFIVAGTDDAIAEILAPLNHAVWRRRWEHDADLISHAVTDITALLAEVERLTADPLPAAAWVREVERAAFQRGVEAMREAAVAVASKRANLPKHSDLDSAWCRSAECILDELRTLPDPEDTE